MLYNEKEKQKKIIRINGKYQKLANDLIFTFLVFYSLFIVADAIIQFMNKTGTNILLIDDCIFDFDTILIIICIKFPFFFNCYLCLHSLSLLENIVNDIVFLSVYNKNYKSSKHIYNFFISYSVINFFFQLF